MFLSHPVWVRGLKLKTLLNYTQTGNVAPRVGAWIETDTPTEWGLADNVAPRVGAWIETGILKAIITNCRGVAPRVGAWIETYFRNDGI